MNPRENDKEALVISGENQLKHFGNFLQNYNRKLNELLLRSSTTHCLVNDDEKGDSETANSNVAPIDEYTTSATRIVNVDYSSRENINLIALLNNDNKFLNKILLTYGSLGNEVNYLTSMGMKLLNKFMYSDDNLVLIVAPDPSSDNDKDQIDENSIIMQLSEQLELLFTIRHFVERCQHIGDYILKQIIALCNYDDNKYVNIQKSFQYNTIINFLIEILFQVVQFDNVLSNSNTLKHMPKYHKTINLVKHNLSRFNYDSVKLNGLLAIIKKFETMLAGSFFQQTMDQLKQNKVMATNKVIAVLSTHFLNYIKKRIVAFSNNNDGIKQYDEVIRITIVAVLYSQIFGNLEQRVIKNIHEINYKHYGITIIANNVWQPEAFIQKFGIPSMKFSASFNHQQNLNLKLQSLNKTTHIYAVSVCNWLIRFNKMFSASNYNLTVDILNSKMKTIQEGLSHAMEINNMVNSIIHMHILLTLPIQKVTLMSICKLVELLHIIKSEYQLRNITLIEIIHCIIQNVQYQGLQIITTIKKKISESSYDKSNRIDVLSSLSITENLLYGPATRERLLISRLTLSTVAEMNKLISNEQLTKMNVIYDQLESLVNLQEMIDGENGVCSIKFLYWHQTMLSIYLKQLYAQNQDVQRIKYMIESVTDCGNSLMKIDVENRKKETSLERFMDYFKDELNNEILNKFANQIEINLRYNYHGNINLEKTNPFNNNYLLNHKLLYNLQSANLNGNYVNLNNYAVANLSQVFYNLTTVSLSDWKTYGEMRCLAKYKFNLNTVDDLLPHHTLEHGLDVLEIMRNIHVFVTKYLYNLNNQIFIEMDSNNKYLNTITIRHIANSLRTHGSGIVNTTVNFTYQFLRKKFYQFSQFLYDEKIKSRLMKDYKQLRSNIDPNFTTNPSNASNYSYERADYLVKEIKKLGMTANTNESYLDLFRKLIRDIGNAIAYIRMIRSGCLHACSTAIVYLPKIDENLQFVELIGEDAAAPVSQAAKNLESDIKNITRNYAEDTEYFRLLIEAFSLFVHNPNNKHLKLFYLIIPALTLNFVEYMLTAKDKIAKKNKTGAFFTDDGFAMGLIFILKLLEQTNSFNSLHWFKMVKHKYQQDRAKLEERKAKTGGDVKLQQTLSLTEKRLFTFQQEFDYLFYNISSAKIFFSDY